MKKFKTKALSVLAVSTLMFGLTACSSDADGADSTGSASSSSDSGSSDSSVSAKYTADTIKDATEAEARADGEGMSALAFEALNRFDYTMQPKKLIAIAAIGAGEAHEEEAKLALQQVYGTGLMDSRGPTSMARPLQDYDAAVGDYVADNVNFTNMLGLFVKESAQTMSPRDVQDRAIGMGFTQSAVEKAIEIFSDEFQAGADYVAATYYGELTDFRWAKFPDLSRDEESVVGWYREELKTKLFDAGFTEAQVDSTASRFGGECQLEGLTSCLFTLDGRYMSDILYERQ